MNITNKLIPLDKRKQKPSDESKLGFSVFYSDHMFIMQWTKEVGWHDACIRDMEDFKLSPAALSLHYAQSVFEGMKAYRTSTGGLNLFCPQQNMARLNLSAKKLTLPTVDESFLLKAIEKLLAVDQSWVPSFSGSSLYIRPTMLAVEPYLGVRSANQVALFVITSPVGSYYANGFKPVSILVTDKYSRACPGGLGDVKAAANYALSLSAEREAAASGYDQVLWLDAQEKRLVEEVGAMNIFFKIKETVITPALNGTILPGITRASILQLLKSWNIDCEERPLPLKEVIAAQKAGTLTEVFGSGTAAVISPVGKLGYQGQDFLINNGKEGSLSTRLFNELTDIQYGRKTDPFGWIHPVPVGNQ